MSHLIDVMQQKPILYAPYTFTQDTLLRLTNISDKKSVAWKIKCNKNERYKMRPVTGILQAQQYTDVFINIEPIDEEPDEVDDVLAIYARDAGQETDRSKVWKTNADEDKAMKQTIKLYFMKCPYENAPTYFKHMSVDDTQTATSIEA